MRPIQLVIIVVALGAAGAAAMLAMNLAKKPAARQEVATQRAIPAEEVLVLAKDIPIGGTLDRESLAWKDWPKGGLNESYIIRSKRPEAVTDIVGMLARAQLLAGEPVREARLVSSDRGFLSAILPKGMRAVAVRVNAASTAGGFILPNDRVDVMLTNGGGEGSSAVARVLLRNIRVLAIDQKVDDPQDKKSVVAQNTATLELTPEQSQLITAAQQSGSISLVLRSIADTQTVDTDDHMESTINVVKFGVPSHVNASE
ncbi:Flp pilus assembly protein CpaB [Hartmannibacter diazotrophicus]|uniref:Flp pilus assembly protein CpaB n=1 Tax=Hartmannibacter diazotrophicus TaxID=1482074 RepID=A0A2C9D2C9_9HYPH|nr:Flp pilus assembly protein CpaB [Hartmannibacter diazotrophicus]SON54416.1 Flp pilus assembly protein CpaB [Hartmannibacter diazotrophicus]